MNTGSKAVISRLAPSPTGNLHLGNIWAFFLCWLMTRHHGGKLILRIDDIDRHRSRPELVKDIIEDLQWLGFDWDDGPDRVDGQKYFQSSRVERYAEVVENLREKGLAYPCFCSRRDLQMLASAPHDDQTGGLRTCGCLELDTGSREAKLATGKMYSLKLKTAGQAVEFTDLIYGHKRYERADYGGDYPLLRADGLYSYQLASAVDDADMGVNLVARGSDLLLSTARQLCLLDYLGINRPDYAHLPLLLDARGERLAKRHASLSVKELRKNGARAERITGFLAWLAAICPKGTEMSLREALDKFDMKMLMPADIRLPERVERFLI